MGWWWRWTSDSSVAHVLRARLGMLSGPCGLTGVNFPQGFVYISWWFNGSSCVFWACETLFCATLLEVSNREQNLWAVLEGSCWLCLWRWPYSLWCVAVLVKRVWRQQWSSSFPTCICIVTLYFHDFPVCTLLICTPPHCLMWIGQARSMQFAGANVASNMLRIFPCVDVGLHISQSLCAKQSWVMFSVSGDQS